MLQNILTANFFEVFLLPFNGHMFGFGEIEKSHWRLRKTNDVILTSFNVIVPFCGL